MSKVQMLRALVKQRLTAAAEEIFGLFERTIAEYEEELCRSKEENHRQRHLLDAVFIPEVQTDHQEVLMDKDDVATEQTHMSPALAQEDPKSLNIKKEQEELWISQKKEMVQGLEEANVTHSRKSEDDGEDCGASQPDRNSNPGCDLQRHAEDKDSECSQPKTVGGWTETAEPQSGLKDCNSGEKHFSSFHCQKRFGLETPVGAHSGQVFRSLNYVQGFGQAEGLTQHVKSHMAEKPYQWSVCDRNLTCKSDIISYSDTEDCRGPEPDSNSHTDGNFLPENDNKISLSSKPDSEVSNEDWKEAGDPRLGLSYVANDGLSASDLAWNTVENPFSCSYCTKTFNRKDNLKRHARIHTGEKPLACNRFKQQDSDSPAPKRSRSEEKRYSCSVCKKRFGWSTDLVRHMRTHTGERPYSCSFCNKGFTQKVTLTAHMTLHTGEKLFRCNQCGKGFNQKSYLRKHKCLEVGSF
ncbi:zinc finger protein OZF-like isoform X2 [Thalassophryne amazonica]|uniref:zinc finger protein OZF-like isoform X2 n=1 Tax=Thalassophryne amazonica TaxID=390379 RepID=UPI001470D4DE|nr:zinc finger protein OZF-like isoform X2 [Thalassophryne amazonica]